jgi:hypothetical protein
MKTATTSYAKWTIAKKRKQKTRDEVVNAQKISGRQGCTRPERSPTWIRTALRSSIRDAKNMAKLALH